MKKTLIILTALLLSGCASQSQISPDKHIQYNNKEYTLAKEQDLGSVAHYIFLGKNDSLQNWQSQIELLFDRNPQGYSLKERINLRKNIYKKTNIAYFDLKEKNHTLYSSTIYAPTPQYNDWQISVAKGKNIPNCGFIQYQYSLKIAKNKKLMNMKKSKVISHLKKYVINKEMKKLDQQEWDWHCDNNGNKLF